MGTLHAWAGWLACFLYGVISGDGAGAVGAIVIAAVSLDRRYSK